MQKQILGKIHQFLGKQVIDAGARPLPPITTNTCNSKKVPLPDKDPNPYEMMAMTRQERHDYEKEYNRANTKLLREVLYKARFVIWPWRLSRKRRRDFLWKRRGRHFERFCQHRQRRRKVRLSTTEKENGDRCFMLYLRRFWEFLKSYFSGSS